MPYYTGDAIHFRGDYYRGDYYRGDPGLFSFIGKALGGVAKLGLNVIRGQLGLSAPAPSFPGVPMIGPRIGGAQTGLFNFGGQGPQTGLINIGGGGGGPMASTNGGAPVMRGYHWNKTTYETRGGGTSRWGAAGSLQIHEKHTTLVRNRRMNVGNARALRHSLHRISGFARLARRVMTFTHARAGKGRFKFHRKKRA